MTNYDCLPFVLTATCEFSQFDDPSFASAGELMFTLPTGGSIAMLTTVRPTHGINNICIAKALMRKLYLPDGSQASRFGDIVRKPRPTTAISVRQIPQVKTSAMCFSATQPCVSLRLSKRW